MRVEKMTDRAVGSAVQVCAAVQPCAMTSPYSCTMLAAASVELVPGALVAKVARHTSTVIGSLPAATPSNDTDASCRSSPKVDPARTPRIVLAVAAVSATSASVG